MAQTTPVLRDTRSFRPFKSSEEYLYAMKEDLAEWLSMLYPELDINVDNFMDRLDTGVALCKHANKVRDAAEEYVARRQARARLSMSTSTTSGSLAIPVTLHGVVHYREAAKPGTFFARDNVSNFITWCRRALGVFECLLFETDDLILRKNEKHVILTLLDVARRGARLGMLAPILVQLEREIDREIAAEQRALNTEQVDQEDSDDELELLSGPQPQIITNDLKSLDEMVRDLVERCQCPVQFPMIRVSEGKYRIGDTKVLIFVRVLRKHVMVRVGGGWDTLSHYLDKHDPCRCKTAHRSPLSAKLILKNAGSLELGSAQVHYERSPPRTRRSSASSISSGGGLTVTATPARSRSPTPRRSVPNNGLHAPRPASSYGGSTDQLGGRSRSPTPRRSVPSNGLHAPRPASSYGGSTDQLGGRSRSPTPRRSVPNNSLHAPRPASSYGGSTEQLRGRSRSPTPTPVPSRPSSRRHSALIPDNTTTTPASDQQLNDSGSEVSDEGYRSLGTVIVSPPASADKTLKPSEDADITEHPEQTDSAAPPAPQVTESPQKPPSVTSTPQHKRSLPLPGSKLSQPPPTTSRSRSTCGDYSGFLETSPRRSSAVPPSGASSLGRAGGRQTLTGTWCGRQGSKAKSRPALTDNTFNNTNSIPFGRSSPQRRSFGGYGSAHSSPSRSNNNPVRRSQHKGSLPSSLQTSPTRQISPLIEEILQVKELDNDASVLQKMREIIQQYADIVDVTGERGSDLPPGGDELDFTSAWVHGNGSLDGIQQVRRKGSCASVPGDLGSTADFKLKLSSNPRKDSKPDGGLSRIPIPVYFGSQDS
ncbi:GAS2-like protein pickled eggs [Anabrus simplex]|uniref:GAS2-like protein pickled eggs n=1 Tax=Anabrus simplex TaxID=316456 RepID=UPI0035A2B836